MIENRVAKLKGRARRETKPTRSTPKDCLPAAAASPGRPAASLLERRPDVVAAERLVLAAFRNLEAAKLALLPTFALAFDGGRLSDALLSLGTRVGTWAEALWSVNGRYRTGKGDDG